MLPVVSLAMMTHAEHTIASGLLAAYWGPTPDGAFMRGRSSADRLTAFVRFCGTAISFTAIADMIPKPVVIELLEEVFETLTTSLCPRGGQVLKFLGGGMLAIFPFEDATR